jgi:hypothetical protein
MIEQYGEKKGKEVFYASINKGEKGSEKWHAKKKYSKRVLDDATDDSKDI